jgi:hypothetical protein
VSAADATVGQADADCPRPTQTGTAAAAAAAAVDRLVVRSLVVRPAEDLPATRAR